MSINENSEAYKIGYMLTSCKWPEEVKIPVPIDPLTMKPLNDNMVVGEDGCLVFCIYCGGNLRISTEKEEYGKSTKITLVCSKCNRYLSCALISYGSDDSKEQKAAMKASIRQLLDTWNNKKITPIPLSKYPEYGGDNPLAQTENSSSLQESGLSVAMRIEQARIAAITSQNMEYEIALSKAKKERSNANFDEFYNESLQKAGMSLQDQWMKKYTEKTTPPIKTNVAVGLRTDALETDFYKRATENLKLFGKSEDMMGNEMATIKVPVTEFKTDFSPTTKKIKTLSIERTIRRFSFKKEKE